MKPLHRLITLVLLLILVVVFSLSMTAAQNSTFRIGILDGQTGQLASGARLAAAEINALGGIRGADGTLFQLELVIAPPDADGNFATAIANMRQANVIAVLGPSSNRAVLDNLQALQSLNIPVMTPATGENVLAADSTGRIFRTRSAEVLMGRSLADYVVRDLAVRTVSSVVLDSDSLFAFTGFTTAAAALGITNRAPIIYEPGEDIADLASEIVAQNANMAALFGTPEIAAQVVNALREQNYPGRIAYMQAESEQFRAFVPLEYAQGVLSVSSWSLNRPTDASTKFLVDFSRSYSRTPDSLAAAGYDSIQLIEEALPQPGRLEDNLARVAAVQGVHGVLRPSTLPRGETNDHVVVQEINPFGGFNVVAEYVGGTRIESGEDVVIASPTPQATATPDGVVATVLSNVLNVRTGPGLVYDVIGQLREGEQRRVLGANLGLSWAVIEFRGVQAWISTASNLVEIFGDLGSVPLVPAPPTPTPAPPTATPPPADIADIVVVGASPSILPYNSASSVTVTIQNIGGAPAGGFAVATSFMPNNQYAAVNVPGLAAGASTVINLPIDPIPATGNFDALIIADLNNQINEGGPGEANNSNYTYRYKVDRNSFANSSTLGFGASIDLDGNGIIDINYNASGISTNAPCNGSAYCIGLLSPTLTWDSAHYDAISGTFGINTNLVLNVALTPGATLGILTDSGKRAVLRVDAINPGVAVTFTYRIYQ